MASRVADFAETSELEEERLRALLSNGDAQERVWACWRLSQNLGSRARGLVDSEVRRAPDAGTRRNFAVVLAGLGERGVLTVLAREDPDAHVRGEAAELYWRTALEQSDALPFIKERLQNETAPDTLCRLLDLNPPVSPGVLADDVERIARGDSSADVRKAAWRRLLAEDLAGGEESPLAHVFSEADGELRKFLVEWWAKSEHHETLLNTATASPSVRLEALASLRDAGRKYSWEKLGLKLTKTVDPDLLLDILRGPFSDAARLWLFGLLGLERDPDEDAEYFPQAWRLAAEAYSNISAEQLTERERLAADRAELMVREHDASVNPNDPEFDPWWDPVSGERWLLQVFERDPGAIDRYKQD